MRCNEACNERQHERQEALFDVYLILSRAYNNDVSILKIDRILHDDKKNEIKLFGVINQTEITKILFFFLNLNFSYLILILK